MRFVYLTKHHTEQNQHRYYSIRVSQTLFGEWAVIRRWGRVGHKGGTVREQWYDDETKARDVMLKVVEQKIKRGYIRSDERYIFIFSVSVRGSVYERVRVNMTRA